MVINPLIRPLGITAAILGTCQGLVWSILTLLSILIYTDVWLPNPSGIFEISILVIFFYPDFFLQRELVMVGDVMLGFSCFYFVASIIWTIASLVLWSVLYNEKWQKAGTTLMNWSIITGIISIFDFILMIILAIDLETMTNSPTFIIMFGEYRYYFAVAIGSMMTIVARGYVLLIAHVILAFLLFSWARQVNVQKYTKTAAPYSNGYNAWQTNADNDPRFSRATSNQGYVPDDRNFLRNQSQEQQPSRFVPPLDNQMRNQRPPPNPRPSTVPQGPYIPAPDYSDRELERLPRWQTNADNDPRFSRATGNQGYVPDDRNFLRNQSQEQ